MLGASAHICGHLIYAHATTDKLMYVGATAAALGPCVAPLIRSMTSKVLPPAERGWLIIKIELSIFKTHNLKHMVGHDSVTAYDNENINFTLKNRHVAQNMEILFVNI